MRISYVSGATPRITKAPAASVVAAYRPGAGLHASEDRAGRELRGLCSYSGGKTHRERDAQRQDAAAVDAEPSRAACRHLEFVGQMRATPRLSRRCWISLAIR